MLPSPRTFLAAVTSLLLCLSGPNRALAFDDDMPATAAPASNNPIGITELPVATPFTTGTAAAFGAPCDTDRPKAVWGIADLRGFPYGEAVASNGVEYNPLFTLSFDFNLMVWPAQHVYVFADSSFWGQKPGAGITNPSQGSFDFSKREFDFSIGAAWNYAGPWEARLFAYSFNNLNRGDSSTSPSGFNDGVGVENRYYLGETYTRLGTEGFDPARATFVSVGYYPSKSMVDGNGIQFKPGAFARAYLTCDLWFEQLYLFADVQFVAARSFEPTLLNVDGGLAARPFTRRAPARIPHWVGRHVQPARRRL